MIRSSLCTLFLVICVTSSVPLGLPQDRVAGDDDEVLRLSADLVMLDVLVVRKGTGQVVDGLKKDDFELREDGVKQHITHFSKNKLPLSIVLLCDAMISEVGYTRRLREIMLEALSRLRPVDEVALIAFDINGPKLIEGLTTDRESIARKVERLRELLYVDSIRTGEPRTLARPGSTLNDAVYQAALYLNAQVKLPYRQVILAVTPDNNPIQFKGPSKGKVLSQLLEPGTTVFGAILSSPGATNPLKILLTKGSVSDFADATGGWVVKVNRKDAGQLLAELVDQIRTRYSLAYMPSNSSWDGSFRRIKVTVSREVIKREGHLVTRTRRGYFAQRRSGNR